VWRFPLLLNSMLHLQAKPRANPCAAQGLISTLLRGKANRDVAEILSSPCYGLVAALLQKQTDRRTSR
jgi:hypothetical protein